MYLTGWQHQTGRLNTWSLPELLGQSVPSSWAWEHLQTAVSKQKITWAGTLAAATDLYSAKRCIKDEEATLQNEKLLFASGQFFWYQKNRDSSSVPLVQTDRDWTNWLIFSFVAVIIFLKFIYPLFQRCYATGSWSFFNVIVSLEPERCLNLNLFVLISWTTRQYVTISFYFKLICSWKYMMIKTSLRPVNNPLATTDH